MDGFGCYTDSDLLYIKSDVKIFPCPKYRMNSIGINSNCQISNIDQNDTLISRLTSVAFR